VLITGPRLFLSTGLVCAAGGGRASAVVEGDLGGVSIPI
jgi:hypothetical protein